MTVENVSSKRWLVKWALFFILAVWFYKVVLFSCPYWAGFAGDGEMVYYFNSLSILSGHRPPSAFHPGTPVQLLGVLIQLVLHANVTTIQPFLWIGYVLGGIVLCASFIGLIFFMDSAVPVVVALAVMSSYFTHPAAPLYLTNWGSYMFHFPLVFISLFGLWHVMKQLEKSESVSLVWIGYAAGFACAVQLLCIPLVVAGFMGLTAALLSAPDLPKKNRPVSFFGSRCASFLWFFFSAISLLFLFTLHVRGVLYFIAFPKILFVFTGINLLLSIFDLLFFWSREVMGSRKWFSVLAVNLKFLSGVMLGWLSNTFWILDRFLKRYEAQKLYTEKGSSFQEVWININMLFSRIPGWTLLVGLTLFLLLMVIIKNLPIARREMTKASECGMAVALFVALFLFMFLPLRQSLFETHGIIGVSLRYLLPAAATVTVSLAWLTRFYKNLRHMWTRQFCLLGSVAVLFLFGYQMIQDLTLHRTQVLQGRASKEIVDQKLGELEKQLGRKPLSLMNGLKRPSCALRWGSANADFLFDDAIDRYYPEEREFDYRVKGTQVPRDQRGADVIFIQKDVLESFRPIYGNSLDNWLKTLGRIEEVPNGPTQDPILMIVVSHQRDFHEKQLAW